MLASKSAYNGVREVGEKYDINIIREKPSILRGDCPIMSKKGNSK